MPPKASVLITDAVHPLLIEGLEAAGFSCDYHPKIDLESVRAMIHQYVGVVINSKIIVDRTFLELASQLKFIARLGSGLEIIDLVAAAERGVAVHRAADGNCDAVAEHAVGMLLAMAINLRQADSEVRQLNWQREANRGWELMGKKVGILGFGYTGTAFAKRLAGFGVQVLAYDKYKTTYAEDMGHVHKTDLETIFEEADVLSLHLPATPETKAWVDAAFLARFKKSIVLVNTSRGNIVATKDLVDALENGQVKGACLDVFENEKPATYSAAQEEVFRKLFALDNVLLTPHIAGWTTESKERLAKLLLNRIMER